MSFLFLAFCARFNRISVSFRAHGKYAVSYRISTVSYSYQTYLGLVVPCLLILDSDVVVGRDAVQVLRRHRYDNSSSSPVVGTLTGATTNSLPTTTTTTTTSSLLSSLSVSCCCKTSTVAGKLLVLTVLWSLSVYTLCRGTADIDVVVDVPAVLTTVVNLVYILSWVFLQRQFVSVRARYLSVFQLSTSSSWNSSVIVLRGQY